jgi:hypothetical protein
MIKRMIKGCPTESDAKASKGALGLMDDQGASESDRKSDARESRLEESQKALRSPDSARQADSLPGAFEGGLRRCCDHEVDEVK